MVSSVVNPDITLAIMGIAITLFLYGLDKIFDLIQNVSSGKPSNIVTFSKALLGLVALISGTWFFFLIGIVSNIEFLLILFIFSVIVFLALVFEINLRKKLKNRPI
jgi:hypothetical protein